MAKRVITQVLMTDDLTGVEIPEGQAESIRFVWDGSEIVVDLTKENAERFRTIMAPYVENGLRVGRYVPTPPSRTASRTDHVSAAVRTAREKRSEIRTWAIERGLDQSLNGRIKAETFDAWDAEHPNDLAPRTGA